MDPIVDKYTRCRILFNKDFNIFAHAKILLLGVGGVGSFCLDGLYRTGIENITIVDCDVFDVTNQNRQIGSEFIGEKKVDVLKRLYPNVTTIHKKIDKEWILNHDFSEYDLVLDAIDDIPAKIELAKRTYKKLISSMGGAKRLDPTKITVAKIWDTQQDTMAKVIKNNLKLHKFKNTYTVIYSKEPANCKEKGSFVGVTASFGLAMCAETINKLRRKKRLIDLINK